MKNELINKMDDYMISALKSGDSSTIDSFLESYGYDIEVINNIADKSFKQITFSLRGQLNSQKDEILLEKVAKYFQDAINKNIEKPISYLRNLVDSNQLAFGHRNLEKLTSDDIKELIKDHNLLDILEKLENDEEL
ncbi:MAG: hypothetical protein M0R21_07215 [Lentimicrobiaceae bacterium]|jgi:hypothetical protein|nr:hypothetical protein [Lentimicrobiaceae bacterium]